MNYIIPLWIGRGTQHLHLRHVFEQREIVALVEALTGMKWEPTKLGNVRVRGQKQRQEG